MSTRRIDVLPELEVRELRYFAAVAEELNFSRAARRLGIAQPPLSRAIGRLERRLGTRLFERTPREVRLTAAGAALLEESDRALAAVSAAARRTRRAAVSAPVLTVTAKPGLAAGPLRRIAERYAASPGAVRVEIAVSGYREQADMVRDGRADCALLSSPLDFAGLEIEPLLTGARVAALPVEHELARRSSLACRDLHPHPFARWPGATTEEDLYWSGRDRDATGLPIMGPAVRDVTQLLEIVALGQAVALIPRWLAESNPRSDIAYRPVRDASPYTIVIAWPERARSRALSTFVHIALELAAEERVRLLRDYAAAG